MLKNFLVEMHSVEKTEFVKGRCRKPIYEKNKWLNNLLIIFKVFNKRGDLS